MQKSIYKHSKKTKILLSLSCTLLSILNFACKDIFETNIKNESVNIILPKNNSTYKSNVTFWWDAMEGATKYRIQIVSPTFDSINTYINDTTIENTRLTLSLNTGRYQWRIKAINGSSETQYITQSFSIDNTAPQAPTLLSPTNADSVASNVLFRWQHDSSAKFDSLFIFSDSTFSTIDYQIKCVNDSLRLNMSEGKYYWAVKSIDNLDNVSNYSSKRKFYVY